MKITTWLVIAGLFFVATRSETSAAWVQQNPIYIGTLQDAAYANGRFVVVSRAGGSLTSPDGLNWNLHVSVPGRFSGLEAVDSLFVGVTEDGNIYTSQDGVSWTLRYSRSSTQFKMVIRAGSILVALGTEGLAVSQNGITWTHRGADLDFARFLAWTGVQFVAVGAQGRLMTSPDGIQWTERPTGVSSILWAVGWTGSLLTVVGSDVLLTSPDGISWTHRTANIPISGMTHLDWTGSRLVGKASTGFVTSTDGITWSGNSPEGDSRFCAWTGGRVVMGTFNRSIWTSQDAINWTASSVDRQPLLGSLRSVAWTGSRIVAVGDGIITSPDGSALTWRAAPYGLGKALYSVASGNGLTVAVGADGTILTSPDGLTWANRTSPPVQTGPNQTGTTRTLYSVTWGGGQWVTVGMGGAILTSPDGIVWTVRNSAVTVPLKVVRHAEGQYVTVGASGRILTSPDGITWTTRPSGTTNTLKTLERVGARWAATDSGGALIRCSGPLYAVVCHYARTVLFTSPDAQTWSMDTLPWIAPLNAMLWLGDRIVGVGDSGRVVGSHDALHWNAQTWSPQGLSKASTLLRAAALAGDRVVVVGDGGLILMAAADSVTSIRRETYSPSSLAFHQVADRLYVRIPDFMAGDDIRIALHTISGVRLMETRGQAMGEVVLSLENVSRGAHVLTVSGAGIRYSRVVKLLP